MTRVLFPGQFDPFTAGHHSVVRKALTFADEVVVVVSVSDVKRPLFSTEERVDMIARLYRDEPRVRVMSWGGLTFECAKRVGAQVIVRGVRNVIDFEYERSLADGNRALSGIETVLLYTDPDLAFISSSMVRELMHHGQDVSRLLPPGMVLAPTTPKTNDTP